MTVGKPDTVIMQRTSKCKIQSEHGRTGKKCHDSVYLSVAFYVLVHIPRNIMLEVDSTGMRYNLISCIKVFQWVV